MKNKILTKNFFEDGFFNLEGVVEDGTHSRAWVLHNAMLLGDE